MDGHSHHSERGDLWGWSISEIEGIMKLLGREFSAIVEGRHTGQPSTSSLTMEKSAASRRRQQSKNLSEQVLVVITSPGLKFSAYSSELFLVVKRMKGREMTMEHREEVGSGDMTQAVVPISRSQGIIDSQARKFHRESSQSFARSSS